MRTVILLLLSNTFMTVAWYGHLKHRDAPIVLTVLVSWLIALPEYALQVPANRLGYGQFTAAQLKIIQEIISISVFVVFSMLYLGEMPSWRSGLAFLLIVGAVALVVADKSPRPSMGADAPSPTVAQGRAR
ncbi:MAG: DMT family protein [Gemmataceae bacterium]|nr:DMT family protein [Gemmataceae bacterium]MDW8263814.1 DMT family protein [Gemmataceae bacterium]